MGRTLFAKELCLCFSLTFILLYFEGGFALSKSSQKGNFKCLGKLPLGYGFIRLSTCMHVRLLHVAQYVQNTAWDILTLKNYLLFI